MAQEQFQTKILDRINEFQRSRKSSVNDDDRFQWKSQSQHIMFFLTYLSEWSGFWEIVYEGSVKNSYYDVTLVHYFILALVVVSPMMLLQNFIGQFTRKGCLSMGEMLPIAYGVGYMMLIISLTQFLIQIFYTAVLLYYFITAIINLVPPWMICHEAFYKFYPDCFSVHDIDLCPTWGLSKKPCFKPGTRTLAPYIFKELIAFKREPVSKNDSSSYHEIAWYSLFIHGIHILILYVLLLVVLRKIIRNIDVALRLSLIFSFVASLAISVVVFTQSGTSFGMVTMIEKIHIRSLTSIQTWKAGFRKVISGLKLAEGGHILFGSFIPQSDPAPHRYIALTAAFCFLVFFISTYYHLFRGLLTYKLGLKVTELNLRSEEGTIFVMFPMILGIQASAHLFSSLYFFLITIISFHSLALKLIAVERSISEHFNISEYYFYIRFAICTFLSALSFIIALPYPNIYDTLDKFKHDIKVLMVMTVLLELITVHLYGIQRFCDDINYYLGTPVGTFLKYCWVLIPVCCVMFLYDEFRNSEFEHEMYNFRLFCFGFLSVPVVFGLIYQIWVFTKEKNLIGILRPMDKYGPPEPEQRILRVLYNPRLVAKYRRQKEFCNHECLLNSGALKIAITDETNLIQRFIEDLKSSTSETSHAEIIAELQQHFSLLNSLYKK